MTGGFERDDLTLEEIEAQSALYGPFTDAVRDLVDATIRTTVPDDEIEWARTQVEAVTARLRAAQLHGAFGVRQRPGRRGRAWGNAVVGLRNPIAPPLRMQHHPDGDGRVWCDFELGAAYEGPPGLVHGGVSALILDQVLGEAAGAGGKPGMTGTLTLRYRRATPLGPLRTEGWIDRSEGVKTWAKGQIVGPEGVTVEAEGVFILPRWAREPAADGGRPEFFE